MADGYVLFEEALTELNMSDEELKTLMDEGKIRHFMDGGKVKFRRKDIDELKASLGIAEETAEEEISLAPPEEPSDVPSVEAEEVPPPPPPVEEEEEFGIEPLDEAVPAAAPIEPMEATAAEEVEPEGEEEIASLSEFEIGEGIEEGGDELTDEEAELLSIEAPGFRSYEEPQVASVGMTVLLIISIVLVVVGAVSLFSFIAGHNPFPFLTDLFVK
ncbi:MAG: MerR family transcriptional regulator [Planctomycetota bacterium]|jgi:hypothetical protein